MLLQTTAQMCWLFVNHINVHISAKMKIIPSIISNLSYRISELKDMSQLNLDLSLLPWSEEALVRIASPSQLLHRNLQDFTAFLVNQNVSSLLLHIRVQNFK